MSLDVTLIDSHLDTIQCIYIFIFYTLKNLYFISTFIDKHLQAFYKSIKTQFILIFILHLY